MKGFFQRLIDHLNYLDEVYLMTNLTQAEREALAETFHPLHDPVNHPSHYCQGGIECIDAIEAALGREGFIAFLRGQVIKYQWRLGHKDSPKQDNAKAIWYCNKLAEVLNQTAIAKQCEEAKLK